MKHLIKIESTAHGVLGVRHAGRDQQYCEAGELVTLKWQPDSKWGLQEAHYTDAGGNVTPIDLTPVKVNGKDVVVFTMPNANITIGGTFKMFFSQDWTEGTNPSKGEVLTVGNNGEPTPISVDELANEIAEGDNNLVDSIDAINPFKGWYANLATLQASHPSPQIGDYAYVKGAESTDPAAIYECTTAGTWSDSGRTADTSNVQTFASSQEVNEVHIVNDLTTGGVDDVLSAEQGKILGEEVYTLDLQLNGGTIESAVDGTDIWGTINGCLELISGKNWRYNVAAYKTSKIIDLSAYKEQGYTKLKITSNNEYRAVYSLVKSAFPSNPTETISSTDFMQMISSAMDGYGAIGVEVGTSEIIAIDALDIKYLILIDSPGYSSPSISQIPTILDIVKEEVASGLVVDSLDSDNTEKALSAKQGKVLNEKIEAAGLVDKTITEETTYGSDAFVNQNTAFVTETDIYSGIQDFDSTNVIKIPDNLKSLEAVCARSSYYNGLTYLSTANINDVVGHYAASGSDNAKVIVNAASIPSGVKYVVVTGRHATISNCYVKFTTETIEKGLGSRVDDLEQSVGFPTRIDRIVDSLATNKRSDIMEKIRPLKVFFIANSFAVQATELLPKLFEKFGYNVIIGVSYLGAATLQQYDDRKDTNNTTQYVKYDGNSWVYPASGSDIVSRSLLQMLDDENWDVVFFIQGSASAGLYSTYEPYYTDLLNWLPLHIQSLGYKVGWFMPWAWTDAKISTDGGNLDGGADNAAMFANICSATEDNEEAHPSFFFCPCGTAVENQLNYYTQEQVWVDGQHTNTEGYYAATLVLFDKLGRHFIGKGISDVESSSPASELGVSAEILANTKVSAVNAIATPYEMTVID